MRTPKYCFISLKSLASTEFKFKHQTELQSLVRLRKSNSHLPFCKEYSRSKVTSHMPLKAVIFHRNVVQSSKRVHRTRGGGRSGRERTVLDWMC